MTDRDRTPKEWEEVQDLPATDFDSKEADKKSGEVKGGFGPIDGVIKPPPSFGPIDGTISK